MANAAKTTRPTKLGVGFWVALQSATTASIPDKDLQCIQASDTCGTEPGVVIAGSLTADVLLRYLTLRHNDLDQATRYTISVRAYSAAISHPDKAFAARALVMLIAGGLEFTPMYLNPIHKLIQYHASADTKASPEFQAYLSLFALGDGSDGEPEHRSSFDSTGSGSGSEAPDPADAAAAGNCGLRRR